MLPLVKASVPRKVDLTLDLSPDLPSIKADKAQIEQVVMNLLINAAEAVGDKPGRIWVTTTNVFCESEQQHDYYSEVPVCGDYVMLRVRDNGEGMDEATLHQIFDPFFTTKFMGRGLGLSAVMGIVRGHDGAIRVVSSPGQGATFELLFPAVAEKAEASVSEVSENTSGRPMGHGTLLVVDDEQIVRDFFQSALERAGYQVVLARDGSEALRIYSRDPERFVGVLLDLVMPVMSGQEVLPHLMGLRPEVRVVVTSGQVEEEVLRELKGFRIAGFIQKPCSAKTLVEKVGAFTGTRVLARG
jgi:CheY-like chemotaxis protein